MLQLYIDTIVWHKTIKLTKT